MSDNRKFYWLKLKHDFFKRHDIRILEEMENGKDYILFYLKLLLESISHEGQLRFSETIPYNEKMLSVINDLSVFDVIMDLDGLELSSSAMARLKEFKWLIYNLIIESCNKSITEIIKYISKFIEIVPFTADFLPADLHSA